MKHTHAVETKLRGFVALFIDQCRSSGIAFSGYSRRDPVALANRNPDAIIVNVKRARHIAREDHGWDLPSEDELHQQAMKGDA
ncbi:hypothetical protein [Haloarcula argentinensis]|uniref:Uncharacterized protein n=1 Tax=Haloarcula argentinensis TaxID=43776 RepID=A0A830FI20_HALAR|nr:hypothetical protein [Haloarcula argentinensis]GGM52279.1 hypothetical protein GCM10009006_36810 [Haloarcula argentinensis]